MAFSRAWPLHAVELLVLLVHLELLEPLVLLVFLENLVLLENLLL